MNIEQWLAIAATKIVSHSPHLDAELLLAQRLQKSRAYIFAFADQDISADVQKQLEDDLSMLSSGYPLAYLLGQKDFWDMTLRVNEHTLIPRADTETIVEQALTLYPPDTHARMIDLGTGSGAIAIALSREFPHAHITATDISDGALDVAKANALRWQKAPITFVKSSWLDGCPPQTYDVIISNPPYIEENDDHLTLLTHEPTTALTSSNHGLADIETIITQALTALKPLGWILLEHGYNQGHAVRTLFTSASGYQNIATHQDLGGNDRITCAQRLG